MLIQAEQQIDQATQLRSMIQQSGMLRADQSLQIGQDSQDSSQSKSRAQSIVVTSGKGGIGKTVIALNLSIALAQAGQRVCLLDGNTGTGHLGFLTGTPGYWDLQHLGNGSRQLRDLFQAGPAGMKLLPGLGSLLDSLETGSIPSQEMSRQLGPLDVEFDYLIIDCESGWQKSTQRLAACSDAVLLLTTLEATSLTETYAVIKQYRQAGMTDLRVLFNRSFISRAQQAIHNLKQTVSQYLGSTITISGCIPEDVTLPRSVSRRQPALIESPQSPACLEIRQLAGSLITQKSESLSQQSPSFFRQLIPETQAAA